MADVLYCVGTGSTWDNNELRYSLRALDGCKGVDRLYIMGQCPRFLDRSKLTFVKLADTDKNKLKNILRKVLYAVDNTDISEHFIYSSDDHFYTKSVDFNAYPMHTQGMLEDGTEQGVNKVSLSYMCKVATREKFTEWGINDFRKYSWHGNTHFWRSVIKRHRDKYEEIFAFPFALDFWTLTGALALQDGIKIDVEPCMDGKVADWTNKGDINEWISKRHVISASDKALQQGMAEWLEKRYPNKSRWEY